MNARDLKEEFKKETGRSIINDIGCHDIDYVGWLEKRVVKLCDIPHVSQRSELLLSAICQFTKRNTQKEIQEVEKWIETDFRK